MKIGSNKIFKKLIDSVESKEKFKEVENKKFIEVSDVFSNKELKNGFVK